MNNWNDYQDRPEQNRNIVWAPRDDRDMCGDAGFYPSYDPNGPPMMPPQPYQVDGPGNGMSMMPDSTFRGNMPPAQNFMSSLGGHMGGYDVAPPVVAPMIPHIDGDGWSLDPPPLNVQPLKTRTARPQGCKTLFIGGLPTKMMEDLRKAEAVIREIFGRIDVIRDIRVNARQFAHIRFTSIDAVDRALFFSGSRLKIGDEETRESATRIYVDFAENRDDEREWEVMMSLRVAQAREGSPETVVRFSVSEANQLAERIKDDVQFSEAATQLMSWLDRGEVNRRNVNLFYTLLQSVNAHTRRLQAERGLQDDNLKKIREEYTERINALLKQMDQIKRIFEAATKQKCWDHFTKAQRKALSAWKCSTETVLQRESTACINARVEDEMEVSDSESDEEKRTQMGSKKQRLIEPPPTAPSSELDDLRAENARLQEQIDTLVRLAPQPDSSGRELVVASERVESEQAEMLAEMREQMDTREKENTDLQMKVSSLLEELKNLKNEARLAQADVPVVQTETRAPTASVVDLTSSPPGTLRGVMEGETGYRIVGVIITFLMVHPLGATVDYIWSYLSQLGYQVRPREVEDLLDQLPSTFSMRTLGVGAKMERRWHFKGLAHHEKSDGDM